MSDTNTKNIQGLLNQIDRNEILLPEFQRGYVWKRDRVRDLMRSLYRKHPTGHILIWNTYKPTPARGTATERNGRSLLLLDGQQRLTTLYVLFQGKAPRFYEGEKLFFDLYFNMQTEEFSFYQKSLMAKDPAWISVHEFLNETLSVLLNRLPKLAAARREMIAKNLDHLRKLDDIREYKYTIDQVSDDDFGFTEVVNIFNEINSKGTPLTNADLALAHICSIWPEARAEMRGFKAEMTRQNFGVDFSLLVRCLVGVATGSVRLEGSFLKTPAPTLQAAWKEMQAAFRHLVGVLRHDAFIDNLADLPTHNVLVPVTVYLARQGGSFPTEAIQKSFIRWIYLAGIWARYSGSSETKLQQDVALVAGGDTDPTKGLEAAILRERGRIKVKADDLKASASSTFGKFSYVLARARDARDWFTGKRIYDRAIGERTGLERHYIFPKNVLVKAGLSSSDDSQLINELANRAALTRKVDRAVAAAPPNKYLLKVKKEQPEALHAQSIPLNSRLWKPERYKDFLAERRKLLAQMMNEHIASLEPKDEKKMDEKTVRRLMAEGENDKTEFKSSLRWDLEKKQANKALENVVVKTLAGFLNGRGGTLLIGVNDDGEAIGLTADYECIGGRKKNRDGFERHLRQIIANNIGESVAPYLNVKFPIIDGQEVCCVSVKPSHLPVYVNDQMYIRSGPATNPLSVDEAVKYIEQRWGEMS